MSRNNTPSSLARRSRSRSPTRRTAFTFFTEELMKHNETITLREVLRAWIDCPIPVKHCYEFRFAAEEGGQGNTQD